ncbi:MAG: 50S ribosomal protein L11 [Candidatus Brocadiia bacterium]
MAKKPILIEIKLQIVGGMATPAPPIGPTLSPHGINLMQFVQQFNDKTKDIKGVKVPVIITIYRDKTFTFVIKTPPAAILVKMALSLESGSAEPNRNKVGKLTKAQLKEIAAKKMQDLSAGSTEAAMRTIEGSCRSMGIEIEQ